MELLTGVHRAVATATDPAGNVGVAALNLAVLDPADLSPPTVDLPFPLDDDVLTFRHDAIGTTEDPPQVRA